jgi:glycosyltransferase involved in cell wall biosynthesis
MSAMKSLLENEAEFSEVGARGRRYAIENFSKEACVTQIETMLTAG